MAQQTSGSFNVRTELLFNKLVPAERHREDIRAAPYECGHRPHSGEGLHRLAVCKGIHTAAAIIHLQGSGNGWKDQLETVDECGSGESHEGDRPADPGDASK